MGKYGKKFRKIQLDEWKGKYFDYKKFKQFIKKYVTERDKDEVKDILANPVDQFDLLNDTITKFTDDIDKEIKRIFVFFTNKEKRLYKDINKYLHQKDDYPEFDLSEYLVHFNQLYELSKFNFNLSVFVFYNLKAILKILKKFDKKVVGQEQKENHILFNYIQTKLEQQNSDILYMFRFKMIDEVNVIMESLAKYLKECLKSNKNKFKEEEQNDDEINEDGNKENLVENRNLTYNEVSNNVDELYKKIDKNMKNIDLVAMSTIKIFKPWKEFLRISSDVSSRLMQMNKEFSFSDVSFGDERKYSRSMSITGNISFSKENKYNIFLTLFHGCLYTFSYSVIIPTYVQYIEDFNKIDYYKYFYGLLMMMAPLGALIGYIYETIFFKYSTKKPYIVSMCELMVGNIFYIIAGKSNIYAFLFVGRFLVGLSNLRSHNKMYIINYLSKKDTNFYLTMFHALSIIGLFMGFFVNIFYNKETFEELLDTSIISEKTLGCLLVIFLSFIFLLLIIFLYSEAHSKKFNKLSVSKIDRNVGSRHNSSQVIQNDPNSINTAEEQNPINVQEDSNMLENLDNELEKFNKQNKFDDTNLVSRSIHEIADQEKGNLTSLKKAFYIYIVIIFSTKFINESIIIYFGLNLIEVNKEIVDTYQYLPALILASSYLMIIVLELVLSKKIECTRDKIFLIIILSMNLINSSCLIYIAQKNYFVFIANSSLAIILSNLIQKTSAHYFYNIIPNNYIICGIQGNVLINILSTIGRISSGGLLIMYKSYEHKDIVKDYFNIIYYSIMTLLSLISLLLYVIFYSDIREKAISRIIRNTQNKKNEVNVATEV